MYTLFGKSLTADEVIDLIRASHDLSYQRHPWQASIIGRRRSNNSLWVVELSRPADRLDDVEAALREVTK